MDSDSGTKNDIAQELCRKYLLKLKHYANKFGLGQWLDNLVTKNKNKQCAATTDEVELLAKMCDDLTINRNEIPTILGKSYRYCCDNDLFKFIRKFEKRGQYSKLDTLKMKEDGKF